MDEEIRKQIEDGLGEFGNQIEKLRSRADKLEKEGRSAADERAKIAELGTKHGEALEALAKIEAANKELQTRLDKIEADRDRLASNVGSEDKAKAIMAKHTEAFHKTIQMQAGKISKHEYQDFMNNVETRDMLGGVDTTGGYLVPENMSNTIIEKFIDINPIRQEATVVNISTGTQWKEIAEKDHPTPENEGETSTATEDEVEFIEFDIKVHPIRAVVPISQILMDDVPALEGLITRIVGRKFQQLESQNFVTGNDVLKARGFAHNIQASSNVSDVWSVTGGGTQLVSADDFMALIKDVDKDYWSNAKYYMNQTTWGNVLNLKSSGGGDYLLRNLEAAPSLTIRGFPVVIANTIASEGDDVYPVFFGDMRQAYTIVDRAGITLLNDPYTDYPVTKLKFSKRVGGRIVLPAALRALKTT